MAKVLTGAKKASPQKAGSEAPAVPVKELYEVGEIPPRGHVPAKMHAWVIRRERHGEPEQAMQVEVVDRSEEHTSELQSLMRISYAVFCLKKKKIQNTNKAIKNINQHQDKK